MLWPTSVGGTVHLAQHDKKGQSGPTCPVQRHLWQNRVPSSAMLLLYSLRETRTAPGPADLGGGRLGFSNSGHLGGRIG